MDLIWGFLEQIITQHIRRMTGANKQPANKFAGCLSISDKVLTSLGKRAAAAFAHDQLRGERDDLPWAMRVLDAV